MKGGKYTMARDEESVFGLILGGAAIAAAVFGLSKYDNRKTQERKNTPMKFPKGLDDEVFKELCVETAKEIKRLKINEVNGLEVKCSVKSSSGLSMWKFSGDFYDHGRLTGKHWICSDNGDSTIPTVFMNKLQVKIQEVIIEKYLFPPKTSRELIGEKILDVKGLFIKAGFNNVTVKSTKKPIYTIFIKKGSVYKVNIGGIESFEKESMFNPDVEVCIYFYDLWR